MTGRIDLFHNVQIFFKTMGFNNNPSQSYHQKNFPSAKSWFLLIASVQLFLSSLAFFLFEARTTDEYGISFFMSITILSVTINILTVAWKIDKILKLIAKNEEFLEKSPFSLFESVEIEYSLCLNTCIFQIGLKYSPTSSAIYISLNEKIKYTCELLHFVMVKSAYIGIILPQLFITAMNYIIYDLKDESYYLTYPMMFVLFGLLR